MDAADHTLTGSLRAVFEEVRDDPSLKKVVLTRATRVHVEGENVVVLPLESPEGQSGWPAAATCSSARSCPATRHTAGSRRPTTTSCTSVGCRWPESPAPPTDDAPVRDGSPYRAVVAASPAQALAATQAFAPLALADVWQTGSPRNDLLLRDSAGLPDAAGAGAGCWPAPWTAGCLLFAPASDRRGSGPAYRCVGTAPSSTRSPAGANGTVASSATTTTSGTRTRELSRVLEPVGALDLRRLGVSDHVVVDRAATLLLTDVSARAVDFSATGRSIVLLLDGASERDELFHDPGLLPVHVVRDPRDLAPALDLPPPAAGDRTRLLFPVLDRGNAARLVRRIRSRLRSPRVIR